MNKKQLHPLKHLSTPYVPKKKFVILGKIICFLRGYHEVDSESHRCTLCDKSF